MLGLTKINHLVMVVLTQHCGETNIHDSVVVRAIIRSQFSFSFAKRQSVCSKHTVPHRDAVHLKPCSKLFQYRACG